MKNKGNVATGIIIRASDAIRQSFCSAYVGKEKFHPEQ